MGKNIIASLLDFILKSYIVYVMLLITSNLDNVQSHSLVVLCVSNTSEFQGVFAKEFQFDENRILEVHAYDCYCVVLTLYIYLSIIRV